MPTEEQDVLRFEVSVRVAQSVELLQSVEDVCQRFYRDDPTLLLFRNLILVASVCERHRKPRFNGL